MNNIIDNLLKYIDDVVEDIQLDDKWLNDSVYALEALCKMEQLYLLATPNLQYEEEKKNHDLAWRRTKIYLSMLRDVKRYRELKRIIGGI